MANSESITDQVRTHRLALDAIANMQPHFHQDSQPETIIKALLETVALMRATARLELAAWPSPRAEA